MRNMSERFFYVRERKIREVKQLVGEKLSTKTSIDTERKRKTAYKIIKKNGAKRALSLHKVIPSLLGDTLSPSKALRGYCR
jgi:hypothetical protein